MAQSTTCSKCSASRVGKSSYCREHRNEYMRGWYARNRDKVRRRNFMRRGRHITPQEFDALLAAQGGVCAICGCPEAARTRTGELRELCIDHCHATGRIRGLLCSACNRGIGMLGDDPQRVQAAADYLVSWKD